MMNLRGHTFREKIKRLKEQFWVGLAWWMPNKLVYWCVVRAMANATTGIWGDTIASELTAFQVLERWRPVEEQINLAKQQIQKELHPDGPSQID